MRSYSDISEIFGAKRFNERHLITRGGILEPTPIPRDDRYLISEMACKNYETHSNIKDAAHTKIVLSAFRELKKRDGKVSAADLRTRSQELAKEANQENLFDLLYEDVSGDIKDEQAVLALYQGQSVAFQKARETALNNTKLYLSICHDLDAYVATSMRNRKDFREMAAACDKIFQSEVLRQYNVRYFDPTLSAANHHEDKGIIECLMVKAAKLLVYCAQHKESLGKVSEYAMALSLGKPVIILCPSDPRGQEIFEFYRDKHPLLRLAEFSTGVIHGAIVTKDPEDVITLIHRIFSNNMEYDLVRKPERRSYYLLKERITNSTVRLITDDSLLAETFWNCFI
jgi:hypothetical protein